MSIALATRGMICNVRTGTTIIQGGGGGGGASGEDYKKITFNIIDVQYKKYDEGKMEIYLKKWM